MFGQSRFSIDVQKSIEQVQLGKDSKFNFVDTTYGDAKFYYINKQDKYPYIKGLDYDDFLHTTGKTKTLVSYGLATVSGILWGHREIYHAYPELLQNYYHKSPTSWIGKNAWVRQYVNNDPDNEHKPEFGLNTFRDIWHFTGTFHNLTLGTSVVLMWSSSYPKKYKWLHTAGLFLTRSIAADLTYRYYSRFK